MEDRWRMLEDGSWMLESGRWMPIAVDGAYGVGASGGEGTRR